MRGMTGIVAFSRERRYVYTESIPNLPFIGQISNAAMIFQPAVMMESAVPCVSR